MQLPIGFVLHEKCVCARPLRFDINTLIKVQIFYRSYSKFRETTWVTYPKRKNTMSSYLPGIVYRFESRNKKFVSQHHVVFIVTLLSFKRFGTFPSGQSEVRGTFPNIPGECWGTFPSGQSEVRGTFPGIPGEY